MCSNLYSGKLLAEEKIEQLITEPKIGGAVIIESQTIAETSEPSADQENISPEVTEETVGNKIGTDSILYTEQASNYEYFDNWEPELDFVLVSGPKYYTDETYNHYYVNNFTNNVFY